MDELCVGDSFKPKHYFFPKPVQASLFLSASKKALADLPLTPGQPFTLSTAVSAFPLLLLSCVLVPLVALTCARVPWTKPSFMPGSWVLCLTWPPLPVSINAADQLSKPTVTRDRGKHTWKSRWEVLVHLFWMSALVSFSSPWMGKLRERSEGIKNWFI